MATTSSTRKSVFTVVKTSTNIDTARPTFTISYAYPPYPALALPPLQKIPLGHMFIHWPQVLAGTKDPHELKATLVFAVQCETEPSSLWQDEVRPTISALAWTKTRDEAERLAKAMRQKQLDILQKGKNKETDVSERDEADEERRLKCCVLEDPGVGYTFWTIVEVNVTGTY